MKIVETDNHGGDYPDERLLALPRLTQDQAERIAGAINKELCDDDYAPRFWKVVDDDYELQPGFQP